MSTILPVTFTASPLPSDFRGSPQQMLDAMVARLGLESAGALSFFVTGATAPGSDVGPWLKNGVTWYVWDVTTGAYVPESLEDLSVRYVASMVPPDGALYTFWIELNAGGQAIAIKTYYAGVWVDIYDIKFSSYATTAAMNAAIAAAVAKFYPASANLSIAQAVDVDTNLHKVLFDTPFIDLDSCWDATNSRYVCPVKGVYRVNCNLQVDNTTGTAATMELGVRIAANGATGDPLAPSSGESTPSPNGARWYPSFGGLINVLAGAYLEVFISGNDGVNTGQVTVAGQSQFFVELVQST